ncbi:MAG TPA: DNA mismatch repair protein MutS, partial [Vicinamibacterales bacterium]|nr:DNA mismatch repair protein MutS [Vicinamibacterales bacterium]
MSTSIDSSSSRPPAAATATPAMRQYLDAKRQYPDAIVFFRMGDFYEMFYEDALVAARALELTLTSRAKDASGGAIPMCGVPHHAVDGYLARLVNKGFRVAMCEQVEDPKKAKGLVRREVVRVVSPGTLTDAAYLEAREPAFLAALAPAFAAVRASRPVGRASRSVGRASRPSEEEPVGRASRPSGQEEDEIPRLSAVGVALVDLSTGEFTTAEYAGAAGLQALADELGVLRPRELVVPDDFSLEEHLPAVAAGAIPTTRAEGWTFEVERARAVLLEQLRTSSLDGFGLEGRALAVRAAGALIRYLRDSQKADLAHVRAVGFREAADAMAVDAVTLRHLEVVEASGGGRAGSLLGEIDRTVTSMGGRLLRAWLLRPLLALERVRDRLDAVEDFAFHATERAKFRDALKAVQDVERLVARAALGSAGPRDLVALKASLGVVPRLRLILSQMQAPLVRSLEAQLDDVPEVRAAIEAALLDEPPALVREGGFIRDGFDPELDATRTISRSGKQVIARMEEDERARTGIATLKVRYNRVFGYYIEISKSNLHAVPGDYQRKQTVAGGERFVTPALKEYEEQVLGADERILARELDLFERLRAAVALQAPRIQDTARAVAALDVLSGLAEAATVNNYTKPHVHDGDEILITDGRHPVVERRSRDPFVPNDALLNASTHQLVILTGPNMGGKSTYLRHTALVCLLAQVGSFVPAREARLSLVDRIFARVGASDNIARGQSTFMVEMQETANILHSATARSLVILDEIGRGTATFDGLSLAWAVAEHLATSPRARPKTIFATHYHELTDLADGIPGVVNCHVDAREWHDEILFLRKVVPGRADRSYGIQVARLAGLPPTVIARAQDILGALEHDELARGGRPSLSRTPSEPQQQLGLFQALPSPQAERLVARLLAIDPDRLTPLEALTLLADLR